MSLGQTLLSARSPKTSNRSGFIKSVRHTVQQDCKFHDWKSTLCIYFTPWIWIIGVNKIIMSTKIMSVGKQKVANITTLIHLIFSFFTGTRYQGDNTSNHRHRIRPRSCWSWCTGELSHFPWMVVVAPNTSRCLWFYFLRFPNTTRSSLRLSQRQSRSSGLYLFTPKWFVPKSLREKQFITFFCEIFLNGQPLLLFTLKPDHRHVQRFTLRFCFISIEPSDHINEICSVVNYHKLSIC